MRLGPQNCLSILVGKGACTKGSGVDEVGRQARTQGAEDLIGVSCTEVTMTFARE